MKRMILSIVMAAIATTAAISITADTVKASDEINPMYVLRAYEQSVAVFNYGETEAKAILDIPLDSLPEQDRLELKTGVYAYNEAELQRLTEDYDG